MPGIDKARCYGCDRMFEPYTNEWYCSPECRRAHDNAQED